MLVAAVFLFLYTLKQGGVASSLPDWMLGAGLTSLAIGCLMWAFPYQPPGTPAA
jgi:hypothetical protein